MLQVQQRVDDESQNAPLGGPVLTNADYLVSDGGGDMLISGQPCVGDGASVRFDPAAMTEGTPYPFRMSGCWFVAVKRPEGHIDFFYVQ